MRTEVNEGLIEREEITPFNFPTTEPEESVEPAPDEPIEELEEEEEVDGGEEPPVDEPTEELEEEEEEEEEEEIDVEVKVGLAKFAAQTLIAQGGLPEDFEITDELTEEDVQKAYIEYKEQPLRNEIRAEELKRLAEEEGLTPEMVQEVKMKYYGVQDEELQKLQVLNILSSYEFKEDAEDFDSRAEEFLQAYYSLKDISPNRVESFVNNDLSDDNLVNILNEAQEDLKNAFSLLDEKIKSDVSQREADKLRSVEEAREKVTSLLEGEVIDNVTYTAEEREIVRKALFEKTEIIVGQDGKRYRTTLYNKRRLEALQDPEKDLANKIKLILGGNSTVVEERTRQRTIKKVMGGLNDYIQVNKKPKPKKKRKPNQDGIQRQEIN